MLSLLRRIVQEVNDTEDLSEAFAVLVRRIQHAMGVDACALIKAGEGESFEVVASAGETEWQQSSTDQTLLRRILNESEPLKISDIRDDQSCKQEAHLSLRPWYRSFLGVPVIFQKTPLGVLLVQQTAKREFDEDHVSFLMTLAAQISAALNGVRASPEAASALDGEQRDIRFNGIPGSPGVAIGSVVVAFPAKDLKSVPDRDASDPAAEERAFRQAVEGVREELVEFKTALRNHLPAEEQALFDAYAMMLSGGSLVDATIERIREGSWAAGALRKTVNEHVRLFGEMESPYLRERADDIVDLAQRILNHLLSSVSDGPQHYPKVTILVGAAITASQLAEVPPDRLGGLVSISGSSSSHVAILARALGVPAIMGVEGLPVAAMDGKELIVNGYEGTMFLQPSGSVRAEFVSLARQEKELTAGLLEAASEPACMDDGEHVPVLVNSGLMPDIWLDQCEVADGIGLYRTELPFMIRDQFPGEHEQASLYRSVLESFPDSPVILRTLDVGGDKALSYFPIHDENPFLGFRGIRISLDHPEIFITQLRAMLLANEELENLQILLPMVGSLQQLEEALMLLEHAQKDLRAEGHEVARVKVGVMIEVPSAVYIAQELAEQADFLSIGSNDLIQYLLAVDRNNSRVARLYDDTSPAVLRALQQAIDGGHQAGKPVSICGEMASDPAVALLLLGMGVDSMSVSLASLPRIKWVIRSFSRAHARQVFRTALSLNESSAIRCLLERELVDAGLGALVRAGR
ncbi:MAG: phosphoenolpyruvate--protein phosphotransferase [bacterium]